MQSMQKPHCKNHRAIACDNCDFWQHIKCIEIMPKEYEELKHSSCVWICPTCDQQNLSDSLIDNQEENPFLHIADLENPFLNFEGSLFDTEYDDLIDHMKTTEKEIYKSNRIKGKLKIMTVNCIGLKSKKKKFYALIDSEQPDIILGTESHLDSSHSNSETIPGPYLALRKDRNINGGGVFIA